MIARPAVARAIVVLSMAGAAQGQPREPVGPFVIDARGSVAGLPTAAGWTPLTPASTIDPPPRGLGIDVGAQVYLARVGAVTLGAGATWLHARAGSTSKQASGPSRAAAVTELTTRLTAIAPQVSLNFGHALGWSYVSAGIGPARVQAEAEQLAAGGTLGTDSGWVRSINVGGGARWFLTDRLGFGFDVRWHRLAPIAATVTHPGAARATVLVLGAGAAVK
jgi:hypothetical protein